MRLTSSDGAPPRVDHSDVLRDRFVARWMQEEPRSALDVGCGAGGVVERLRSRGVRAAGVEASPRAIRGLVEAGLPGARAAAEALPFSDDAFDWVGMRHVPHHLPDLDAALAEATRVARVGVILADPWRDESLPEQRIGRRLDTWMKRQDRRAGRVHEENVAPRALWARLPDPASWSVEYEFLQRVVPLDPETAVAWIESRLEGLADDDPEVAEGRRLLALGIRGEIGATGTALLVARRGEPTSATRPA